MCVDQAKLRTFGVTAATVRAMSVGRATVGVGMGGVRQANVVALTVRTLTLRRERSAAGQRRPWPVWGLRRGHNMRSR